MKYRYPPTEPDYSDYASGAVFYGAPGQPNFPVRLAGEIFQRCQALRAEAGFATPATLYDPCCGSAYLLSTLAYLHWEGIAHVIASDIDESALAFARRNLGLLTLAGMDQRIVEIESLLAAYGKESHAAALKSAQALRARLTGQLARHAIVPRVFQADATAPAALRRGVGDQGVDVVLTDIPYGRRSHWQSDSAPAEAGPQDWVARLLEAVLPLLAPGAVVAVAATKDIQISHPAYRQAGRLKLGKRQVVLLRAT